MNLYHMLNYLLCEIIKNSQLLLWILQITIIGSFGFNFCRVEVSPRTCMIQANLLQIFID